MCLCLPIIFKIPLKSGFPKRYTTTICVKACLDGNKIFLIRKKAFDGLLKVIGLQKLCIPSIFNNVVCNFFSGTK